MYPDVINIPSIVGVVKISTYAFFVWIALGCMSVGLYKWSRNYGIGLLIVALFGARLMHVMTNSSAYAKDPLQLYSFDVHGLSVFGAIILVGLFILIAGYVKRVPLWKKLDPLVPYIGISIMIARIGCFLNGCCFGVVTRMPWGVRFPLLGDAHLYQIAHGQTHLLSSLPVHPTQLYEIAGTLIGTIIAMRITLAKRYASGDGLMTWVGVYSFTRFVTHFFRAYPDSFSTAYLFPFLYIGISVSCFAYLFRWGYLWHYR